VTLIDTWPANVEKIKADGITVKTMEEEFNVKSTALHLGELSAANKSFDIVFLAFKSFDTAWASKFIEPYLAPGGYVVSAQNGINEESIATVLGWTRVVGLVITLGAAIYEPGRPQRTSPWTDRTAFTMGEPSGLVSPRLEKLCKVMGTVGLSKTTTNLWGERWGKLSVNAMGNSLAGMGGLKTAEVYQNPVPRKLTIRVAHELTQVATALGVSVGPIGGIAAARFTEAMQDGAKMEALEGEMVERSKALGIGRPSMAQDLMKRRKTEIDFLNGHIVTKGREIGIATPVNEQVVATLKRVERGEITQSIENVRGVRY